MPQFLKTCDATTKEDAKNLGVVIKERMSEKIHEVVQAARKYHTDVPVLIITRGAEKDELPKVVRALLEALTNDPRERMRNRERMRATGEWSKLRALTRMGMASLAASPPSSNLPSRNASLSASPVRPTPAPTARCQCPLPRWRRTASSAFCVQVRQTTPKAPPSAGRASSVKMAINLGGIELPGEGDGSLGASLQSSRSKPTLTSVSALCPRIQLLQERDEEGRSMIASANTIIDQATKRCYSDTREAYFRVTVTDWFGGRGHDFDCLSEHANSAGGMLVIATSIPDAREWAQWKGRTARQDRPGQCAYPHFGPPRPPWTARACPHLGAVHLPGALGTERAPC